MYARMQKRHRCIEQSFGLWETVRVAWFGRMAWNMYVKQTTSPGVKHDTGCSGLVHWDNQQGWYEEGGVKGVQDGAHVYTSGAFMLMYGKTNTSNIVKQLDSN